jgi:hypothetical protein
MNSMCFKWLNCLSLFGLLQQNTTNLAVCKQQKFVPHGFGGWEMNQLILKFT